MTANLSLMMKLDDFRNIFRRTFDDTEKWQRWFFASVATDADEVYLSAGRDGNAASALLMQPYDFLYRETIVPAAYISCVATLPESRSQGLASRTLRDALGDARRRGYALCALIPAEEHLVSFYEKQNFASVFYQDFERYTSVHKFQGEVGLSVEPSAAMLHRLEMRCGCGFLHSASDYDEIVADMNLDGESHVIAVADAAGGEAMLFAVVARDEANVKCLLADSEMLAQSALAELRRRVADKAVSVSRPPLSGDKAFLKSKGMARITNPQPLLAALAASDAHLRISINLTDSLLAENSGVYLIDGGRCSRSDQSVKADLEVDVSTLAAILFSNHHMGALFGIPSRRPYMALMLD